MSKKRHLRRYTNRTPPAEKPGRHRSNDYLPDWERWLSLIEQVKDPFQAEIDRQTHAIAAGQQEEIDWDVHVQPTNPKFSDNFARQMAMTNFYEFLENMTKALDVHPDDVKGDWNDQTPASLASSVQKLLTALSQKLQPENVAPPRPMRMPQMPQMGGGGDGGGGEEAPQPRSDAKKPKKEPKKVPKKEPEKEPKEEEDGPPEATYEKKKYKKPKPGQDGEEEEEGDDGDGEGEEDGEGDYDEDADSERGDDEDEDDDDYERPAGPTAGGGGQTRKEALADSAFWAARQAIVNLCVAPDPLDKPEEGTDTYNLKRVAKSAYNPATLNNIRDRLGQTVDNVYLILDTSGSVSEYADKIATIAAAAAGIVHIYSGTEARPEWKADRSTPLASASDKFPEWRHPKDMSGSSKQEFSEYYEFQRRFNQETGALRAAREKGEQVDITFEGQVAWFLKKEHPPKGSHIIFWTDTYGCGIVQGLVLKGMLSDYHVTLMIPQTREELENKMSISPQRMQQLIDKGLNPLVAQGWFEAHIFVAAGAKIFYGIQDGRQFADALKKL